MAKKIEEIAKTGPVKKQTKKGVKQRDVRTDFSDREKKQIIDMTSDIAKTALKYRKVIGIFITMDVNGKFQIVHFGAGPEISKRSKYLCDNLAKEIEPLINAYDIPVAVDLPPEKIKS